MDIVYIVGPGPRPQLRYSLRSLQNLEHGTVWVVGERPAFLSYSVRHLSTPRQGIKWQSAALNLRKACSTSEVSSDFVLMNDDFFILRPTEQVPSLHRGRLSDVTEWAESRVGRSKYVEGMIESKRVLSKHFGIEDPLAYNLHTPMVLNKYKLLETLDACDRLRNPRVHATDIRTMYGNMHRIRGRKVDDVKIHRHRPAVASALPFRSTSPQTWDGPETDYIRALFPTASKYERLPTLEAGSRRASL